MKVAIVGFARDGQAAYAHWKKDDNELTICDQTTDLQLPDGAKSQLGPDYLKNLDQFDLIVRTAGIPPRLIAEANPQTPDILNKVTGNIDAFFEASPSKNIIGVTGTKGKGTTSTLIAKMLEAAGKKVHLGGNIGIPALELLKNNIQPNDWVVLEQSSFQLIDQKHSPHIAVCLMIEPEHLNWHANMDEYVGAKKQLFAHQTDQDIAVYFADNETSKQIASAGKGRKVPYMKTPGAEVIDGIIQIDDKKVCKSSELKLLGKHNWQNACAAVTVAWQVDQNIEAMRQVLINFAGLEHRLELVREVNGVKYFNDSFASAPPAPAAALEAIEGMKVMILGGQDRGLELNNLTEAINDNIDSIRKLLLIGESAERIGQEQTKVGFDNYEIVKSQDMDEIVNAAKEVAQSGDSVILSPGFPSFDMFKDFEERGKQFKVAVDKL